MKKTFIIVFSFWVLFFPCLISAQEKAESAQKRNRVMSISLNLTGPLFYGIYELPVEVVILNRLSISINPIFSHSELSVLQMILVPAAENTLWSIGAKIGTHYYPSAGAPLGSFAGLFINTAFFKSEKALWDTITSSVTLGPGVILGYRGIIWGPISAAVKAEMQYLFPIGLSITGFAPVRADQPAIVGLSLYLGVEIGLFF